LALAQPSEILTSRTVHDVLDGSSFEFEDRGLHELKGLSGERPVFAITNVN
jgi:class 3 adenylate cyclase